MTTYKVLVGGMKETGWLELSGEYKGANDEAAIRAALASGNGEGDPSGVYVAVPVRSWKPRSVKIERAVKFV